MALACALIMLSAMLLTKECLFIFESAMKLINIGNSIKEVINFLVAYLLSQVKEGVNLLVLILQKSSYSLSFWESWFEGLLSHTMLFYVKVYYVVDKLIYFIYFVFKLIRSDKRKVPDFLFKYAIYFDFNCNRQYFQCNP